MRPRNLTPFLFGATVTSRQPPQPEMTMIVRGTFTLRAGGAVTPLEGPAGGLLEQGPLRAAVFAEDDEDRAGACLYPGDFADYKPRAEVFLVGRCHPPGGKPVAACDVRIAVGAWSKTLRVSGKREWRPPLGPPPPQPFEAMPLDWSRAFGGPGCDRNPCGVGFDGKELPNVEAPAAPMRSPADRPEPVGFGPINPAWPQRAGTMGTKYDAASYAKRAPFYAEDFDWTHFLAAPRDQWLEGYLRGDEEVVLQNVHPVAPVFSTRLPGLRIRAFAIDRTKTVFEARMNLDTLFVDAEKGTLVLTWRGHVPCREIDRSDMEAVLVASEKLADEPLPLGHYQPLLEAFHADPVGVLMDEVMPGAREARAALDRTAASLPKGDAQSSTDAALAVLRNPDVATLGVPEAERPQALERAEGAAQRIEQALASEKEARAQAQAALPKGVELPAVGPTAKTANELAEEAPDVRAQVTRAIQDALREARGEAEKARAKGTELPGKFAEQLAELEKLQARIADPEVQKKLAMASPPHAAEIGPDRDLSNRNMTGRDFSGLDLSGTNLEGAILSGARLVGTRLAGANLRSATLQGADLAGADLSHADLTRANLNEAAATFADFRGARLEQTLLARTLLRGARFDGARGTMVLLSGADLSGARFARARFFKVLGEGTRMEEADFADAEVVQCAFVRCKARKASFSRASLPNTTFMQSDLRGAVFARATGVATSFMNADLAQADFRRCTLHDAHFMEASAVAAVFWGADLRGAELIRAVLDGATFERANLFGANLGRAVLNGTRFTGASLYRARFTGASGKDPDFEGANVKEAVLPS